MPSDPIIVDSTAQSAWHSLEDWPPKMTFLVASLVTSWHTEPRKSLAIPHQCTRFGTEGSEVQILSPRPIPKKTCRIQAARSLGSSVGVERRNRVLGALNPAFFQNRSRFLASVPRDWSIPPAFASKVLPST